MAQITEDYCSFETAKLLKEKGFDWVTHRSYLINDNIFIPADITNVPLRKDAIRIPTLQMAMKWLREVHKLHIWIANKLKQNKGLPWYYEIHNIETGTVAKIGDIVCGSYEVACEAAIKYCLENLI